MAKKTKLFLKIYFWLLFILTTVAAIPSISLSMEDMGQTVFTYIAFISLFGYAYDKKIFNQLFWKIFLPLYFMWEAGCYILITKFTIGSVVVFVMLAPKYWSLVCYTLITHETNEHKKILWQQKMDNIFYTLFPFLRKEYDI